jgi:transcriptional regulator with XRE-family HTH domain
MTDDAALPEAAPATVGSRIRQYRHDRGLSLNQLAAMSGISKGYLSTLETAGTADPKHRPSGETLYAIAEALGVTMSDLLGRKLIVQPDTQIEPSLREFADSADLTEADVQMLASIQWRGQRPQTTERWRYIYQAITTSKSLDPDAQPDRKG